MNNREKYAHLIGKKIHINVMVDEPRYADKEGIVELVDDWGQLHGTWGGLAVQPERDDFYIVEQ